MKRQKLLIGLTLSACVLLLQLSSIKAACICNAVGTDYCQSCTNRPIIRPKPLALPAPDLELPPIGDNCWCSKLMIEPAKLPKPPCPQKNPPSCSCAPAPPTYVVPSLNYIGAKKDYSAPADPISLSLAAQAGKAIAVPEAKLAFGFVQKPIDDLKKIYFSSVPEENLFKLKNEVIVLKKPKPIPPEEEELLEIEEEEAPLADEDERPQITYQQLGYITEQFKNPKFRKLRPAYGAAYAEEIYKKPAPAPVEPDCDFIPGRIAPYRFL